MAAGTFTLYSKNKHKISINDLTAATVKIALLTSAYTPDVTVTGHSVLVDVSANEIAAGFGYTAGGLALSSLLATAITGGYKFSSANAVWTPSGGSIPAWRYGVMYVSGTLWGLTSPLVGYFLGDTTPADIPPASAALTITCNANGWFDIT